MNTEYKDNPPNEAQKQAMIAFCVQNAGNIKYVPHFNVQGVCTVSAYQDAENRRRAGREGTTNVS